MTHDKAIDTLLDQVVRGPGVSAPAASALRRAQEHVRDCSDCWEVFDLLKILAHGKRDADGERMLQLYGCDRVRRELYLLVGVDPEEARTLYPTTANHVAWCHACRERLVDLLQAERAAARGELGPDILAPPPLPWKVVAERSKELLERLVVRVRHAAAAFAALPEGLVPVPLLAAGMVRSPNSPRAKSASGQQVRIPLGDSGTDAQLTIEHGDDDRLLLTVNVLDEAERDLSVILSSDETLFRSKSGVTKRPVVLKGVLPGRYVLEIRSLPDGQRYRMPLVVERPAADLD